MLSLMGGASNSGDGSSSADMLRLAGAFMGGEEGGSKRDALKRLLMDRGAQEMIGRMAGRGGGGDGRGDYNGGGMGGDYERGYGGNTYGDIDQQPR